MSETDPGKLAVAVGDNTIRVWDTANTQSNHGYDCAMLWKGLQSKVTCVRAAARVRCVGAVLTTKPCGAGVRCRLGRRWLGIRKSPACWRSGVRTAVWVCLM